MVNFIMKKYFALATMVSVFAAFFAFAGPPTCTVCVTDQFIPFGTDVFQTWVDEDGKYHHQYLNHNQVMCLHNGAGVTVLTALCDGTSNRCLRVLFTCPPSTNPAISFLWLPAHTSGASWDVNWFCKPSCTLVITPAAVYPCGTNN